MAALESPMAVVETETFLASATRLRVSEEERAALIIYLATNPEVGRVVPETGAVQCRVKKVYRIQIRFPGSEIRRG